MWIPSLSFMRRSLLSIADPMLSGAVSGPLGAAWLGLYILPTPVLSYQSVMDDITEATFHTYSRKELVWDLPYFGSELLYFLEAASLHWQPSDSAVPNTITGLFVADAETDGNLLLSTPVPAPGIPMSTPLNALTIIARFGLDSSGNWGDFTSLE